MTGGAGFSNDAMNTGRSNRANRTSKNAKFKDGQNTYLTDHQPLKFKEVSDEELQKIKSEIRENAKKERIKTIIIGFVVGAIVILVGLYLIF
jgi:predicted esterase